MANSRIEELPDEEEETELQRRERLRAAEDEVGEGLDEAAAARLKKRANALYSSGDVEGALRLYCCGIRRVKHKPVPEPKRPSVPREADAASTAPASAVPEGNCSQPPTSETQESDEKSPPAEAEGQDYTLTAQLHCNAAAAKMKLEQYEQAIPDLNEAIRHDENYVKAVFRRAECNWRCERYSEVHADLERYEKLGMVLDPETVARKQFAKQKMDEEMKKMWGQLKDLGNTLLGKFGLSTDNFKFTQDPATGGYSVNFQK